MKNGVSVKFWHDWWIEKRSLKDKYPRLYRLSRQKIFSVSEMNEDGWRFDFSREFYPAERIDFLELKFDIRNIVWIPEEEDTIQGDWSSKSIYKSLTYLELDRDCAGILSSKFAPPKVLFLVWAALYHSVPTRSMLQDRGVEINSNRCLSCNDSLETLEHLFIHCDWVKDLWDFFIFSLHTVLVMPGSLKTSC